VSTFPTARKSKLGYDVRQVDAFLARARDAYNGSQDAAHPLTSIDIRRTAFGMQRGGYSTSHVDAALERLEDAFAAREREDAKAAAGEQQWLNEARTTAQVIINRLGRPAGEKFQRAGVLSQGYNRSDVDRFSTRLMRYFQDGKPVSVEEVRTVVFRPQRHGYREVQVDLLLDSVTDVMLAVR
jgi:DivIVA domain-containing protein